MLDEREEFAIRCKQLAFELTCCFESSTESDRVKGAVLLEELVRIIKRQEYPEKSFQQFLEAFTMRAKQEIGNAAT